MCVIEGQVFSSVVNYWTCDHLWMAVMTWVLSKFVKGPNLAKLALDSSSSSSSAGRQLISTLVGHDWFWHDFVTKLYSLVMDCVRFPWPTKNFGSSQRKFLQGGALDAKSQFFLRSEARKKNRPLIGSPNSRSAIQRPVFWQETTWTHVLTLI